MHKIKVKSSKYNYEILIGRNILARTGEFVRGLSFQGKIFILTQKNIAKHYLPAVEKSLKKAGFPVTVYYVPDGEKAKSPEVLVKVYEALLAAGFERGDMLAALGGGVVGDLGGFAASTYLRGIAFVNIATTLLAQVDSAIGGKTAVNLKAGKNLAGTFYPPRLVISDIVTLKTLPARELTASLAEVVKYGVIRDPVLFKLLETSQSKIARRDLSIFEEMVKRSARIKAGVVSRDEFETLGERMILNYGHTFGHAFEGAGNFKTLLHGEAVSVGMHCAALLAEQEGFIKPPFCERQQKLLKALGLPCCLAKSKFSIQAVMQAMMHDKKKRAGKIRFILPTRLGKVDAFHQLDMKKIQKLIESKILMTPKVLK